MRTGVRKKLETHRNEIQKISEFLRTTTYVLPTKYFGNQSNTELAYAIFTLIKSSHLWVIGENTPGLRCGRETKSIRVTKRVLEVLTALQVWLELKAAVKGEKRRWLGIAVICGWKFLLRMRLLYNNRGGIMCPSSEEDLKLDEAMQSVKPDDPYYNLRRTYIMRGRGESNPHGYFSSLSRHLLPSFETSDNCDVSSLEKAAETIYWARPLIYSILMYRAVRRKNAWGPLLSAVGLHLLALYMMSMAHKDSKKPMIHKERDRRWLLLLFYFLRPPMLRSVTQTLSRPLAKLPAVGWAVDYLMDLIDDLPNFQTFGES